MRVAVFCAVPLGMTRAGGLTKQTKGVPGATWAYSAGVCLDLIAYLLERFEGWFTMNFC